MSNWIKNYSGMIWLITGIIAGSIAGIVLGERAEVLKPIGDIFLNLLFVAVIPLVFFAISSAIANLHGSQKLGRIMGVMSGVFLGTLIMAALLTIFALWLFPIGQTSFTAVGATPAATGKNLSGDQITQLFTTSEFFNLLSRKNMLAMIIFAILVGFGVRSAAEKGQAFVQFLNAGNEVFKQVFGIIMKAGPIGLGAYFAYQVAVFGPSLFGTYAHVLGIGYGVSLFYYAVFYSLYAFIAGGVKGIKRYWENNIIPSATAVGTCSSIATIPANLDAAKKMGITDAIAGITIPLLGTLHKDGSSISSILKMSVVFAMFGRSFDSAEVIVLALGMTVLVSIVEGGIPNGGYIGELLFISAYGFPPEALPPAIIIGTLIDPVATLLNATGDTAAAMLINRFAGGKQPVIE
ncbi:MULTISPECIES: dicarboxylate/amino acid:cation symporter [unclassified Mucilaginibacter]|uniref:dicarboxylate/amino acid:cation symporter n=1 Tax=unclassified Mucilaginibacter TaxID=2617802 RepID=UPI002AC8F776|nr:MULTISPECIES: dicarboxylate/amino acid:cation symporter [unclassified Mucilaginibacter]MEB0263940.1 dicarboxylate/amino acid:cation symporter [Mucilaginibacter sp. 10I4]MEB0277220.1 dicarboxylate/amino acid:cation symporter [Mucilaginibacter sp. 10B2]MEB0300840.1 dicarboxylate/amino acid:cation symporter [Mucilaginibacter sp. 5C4]WPX25288.1 dicarboxylate/amino acid:cation symporter [Mucilaginibacter sp. 5C4]